MFEPTTSNHTENWQNAYNAAMQKFKSLYGKNICFKAIPTPIMTKKRRLDPEQMGNGQKKKKKKKKKKDCINELSEDEHERNKNKNIVLEAPINQNHDIDINAINKRNSKQIININARKNNLFKPNHQKRHKVKTTNKHNSNGNNNNHGIAENHPLFQNDPLIKAKQNETMKDDGNCLHWIAKGVCGYKNDGKCRYNHPDIYDAKNFYCPTMKKNETCHRGASCIFTHNLRDIPCEYYYTAQCQRNDCERSHLFTDDEFNAWFEAKKKKQSAWIKWKENQDKKNSTFNQNQLRRNNHNDINNQPKDERLTSTATHQLFTSALTD